MEVGRWKLEDGSWIWKLDLKVGSGSWKMEVGSWKMEVHMSKLSLTCLKLLNMVRNAQCF